MTVICSCYEHDSAYQWSDFTVKSLEELEKVLKHKKMSYPVVVFWMGINNITGEIFPILKIGEICHNFNAFYICDATSFFSHEYIPDELEKYCDGFIINGHKIGAEVGYGLIWMSDNLRTLLTKSGTHTGTPNLKEAITLQNITEYYSDKKIASEKIHDFYLFDTLVENLKSNQIDFRVVAEEKNRTKAINAIQLLGVNASTLQNYLCSQHIYVGLGQSSCADEEDNRILCEGYGLSPKDASEVIRISFNHNNYDGEIIILVKEIKKFKEMYCNEGN